MTREHQILATHLASYISDRGAVTSHVNRQFATRYSIADIDNMLQAPARKPTDSQPRHRSKYADDPIAMHQPLRTTRGGIDPLAKACLEYGIKHGGVMGANVASCRAMLEALKA